VSFSYARGKWEVRWRDATGRQRSKRFRDEAAAKEFNDSIHERDVAERARTSPHRHGGGVYAYETVTGTRWRYVVRRSGGSLTSKRGFASETAARTARRRAVERDERGEVRHTRETFGAFFGRWLARRKPYVEPGTWRAPMSATGDCASRQGSSRSPWVGSTSNTSAA
jgi:hypothetical protein